VPGPRARPASPSRRAPAAARRSLRRRAEVVVERLAQEYPGDPASLCALRHRGPFQLLVATILSAQTTDERVNMVTPALFDAYPTPEAMAAAPVRELEELVRSTGFFRSKARSLSGMARALVERYGGRVPRDMEQLTSLPGVGRKTANVVRSVGFGLPGLPVDTHVGRLARRLGLTESTDPAVVEEDLCALVEPDQWGALSLRLILHGRSVCRARAPRCGECVLVDVCPSADVPTASPLRRTRAERGVGEQARAAPGTRPPPRRVR
jgi:endonuclease-3